MEGQPGLFIIKSTFARLLNYRILSFDACLISSALCAFLLLTGVIGTCKLHFDIWGDSVNVASRMYSTAEPNKIQLTEKAKDVLQEEKWDSDCFSYRGKVFVKGKGHMDTFYFKEPSSSKGN